MIQRHLVGTLTVAICLAMAMTLSAGRCDIEDRRVVDFADDPAAPAAQAVDQLDQGLEQNVKGATLDRVVDDLVAHHDARHSKPVCISK